MQRLTILLLLLMFIVVASGQVYKWVDANGKTQYTDQPPPPGVAQDERELEIKPAPPSSNNLLNPTGSVGEDKMQSFGERRTARKEAKEENEKKAAALEKQCIDAQSKLRIYRDTPRLRMPDGQGDIAYVEDDVREKHIQAAQKDIATYCK